MSGYRRCLCAIRSKAQGGHARPRESLASALGQPALSVWRRALHTHHRKRAADILEHLQLLIDTGPDRFWFVRLDNASAHSTADVRAFAAEHQDRLELVYLPTYSPHFNLIERLWRIMSSQVTRNRFYESLTAVVKAAVDWLQTMPVTNFCSMMGIDENEMQFVAKPFS